MHATSVVSTDRQTSAVPLADDERLGSLDLVRGVAVLGILAMNIRNFALPLGEFDNPRWPRGAAVEGGVTTLASGDFWTWLVTNALFEDKMITIFGLLFGAGVVVFGERLDRTAREARERGLVGGQASVWRSTILHYRRMFWLLVIGLLHAYLLWYGDILNTYAICGLLIWPMRKLQPGVLIGMGVLCLLVAVWWRVGPGWWDVLTREAGAAPTPRPPTLSGEIFSKAIRTEEAAYRGGWLDLVRWRAHLNTVWHFLAGVEFTWWRSLGQMLMGMGLMRLGMLRGTWRVSGYIGLALAAYGIGLTLTLLGMGRSVAGVLERGPEVAGAAARALGRLEWPMRFIGALGVALGHIGVLMAVWTWASAMSGTAAGGRAAGKVVDRLLAPLRAVGRMALSNYLMHTVICVLIFDGWAGGQWDRWRMSQLYLLVAGVWAAQLIISPLWLRAFRFGPVEWAWRSLTYWRVQPMRR